MAHTPVLRAFFRSRELHGTMAKFGMHVIQLWRLNRQGVNNRRGIFWPAPVTFDNRDDDLSGHVSADDGMDEQKLAGPEIPVWVRLTDLRCKCPEIELGISYMIVTDFESFLNRGRYELLFTTKTALLPWRASWRRRLSRLRRRENRGACERQRDTSKLYSANTVTASARRRNFNHQRQWYSNMAVPSPSSSRSYSPTTAYGYRLTPHNLKSIDYNNNNNNNNKNNNNEINNRYYTRGQG